MTSMRMGCVLRRSAWLALLILATACTSTASGGGGSDAAGESFARADGASTVDAFVGGDGADSDAAGQPVDAQSNDDYPVDVASDVTPDALPDAPTTSLDPCSPACNPSTQMCQYQGGLDGSLCDTTCPTPWCQPIPAACAGAVTCDCLLKQTCTSSCLSPPYGTCGYKDGQWILQCFGC